ncbi:MAG: polysaccharide biosynthesis protein [Spirochaetes bacterium]|nr:polysaccharide biosynthesis protein [Spirochaetota bacterium]
MDRKLLIINIVLDFVLFIFSLFFALWLRFNTEIPYFYLTVLFKTAGFIAAGKILIHAVMGVYRIIVRFMHTYDVLTIVKANVIATFLFGLVILASKLAGSNLFLYPRAVVIIDFILSLFVILGIRFLQRFFIKTGKTVFKGKKTRALIVGAGEAGSMVLREIRNHPASGIKVLGFIDDNRQKINMSVGGKRVLGNREDIIYFVDKLKIDLVIIAIPSARPAELNHIVDIAEKTKVKIKIVPSTYEIITGDVKFEQIRDIKIEDLLGREEIKLDTKEIEKYIKNKNVLITGAGGSIGSEIARQVSGFKPKDLILLGKGENSIFNIHRELAKDFPGIKAEPVVCDIRDEQRLERIFKQYKIDVVFHSAAHKHVFLMELAPDEAFKNNVIGTLNLVRAAVRKKVKRFVLISTDKAVYPKSVMGITKKIAENAVLSFAQAMNRTTKFMVVRFGNVFGSRGSVIPIFRDQIKKGGPVTVTHPDVSRYFMTIPEAVQLVLQASGLGRGGEIFILDMGAPVRISDLARRMIHLSGFEPDRDIKIKYIGLGQGEKLNEELYEAREHIVKTKHEKILSAIPPKIKKSRLLDEIETAEKRIDGLSRGGTVRLLKHLLSLN